MRQEGHKKRRLSHRESNVVDKTADSSGNRRVFVQFLLPLVIFCWPVLYLFDHVFPIGGYYTGVGNDFVVLYYKYKVYLLACLANFHFPLWSPSEGCGFPFYASPFTQVFYPLNLLLVGWYKAVGGYNVWDHLFFTILGISIFALGLYQWLRLINSNIRAVIFSCLVMSVSFKMTEILRFPNAVHSVAWYPWILYAVTKIIFGKSLKGLIRDGILLIFFVICLCTAGYPYYIYYSVFLFVPYILVFLINPLRQRLFGRREIYLKRVIVTLAAVGLVTLLLCGPYLLSIKSLMSETTDRTGKDFEYSTYHIFSFEDTLGSLVYPPDAQTEGLYFFSITAFLLIALYLFSQKRKESEEIELKGDKRIISPSIHSLWVKLFFIIWISMISYITYGRHSYLFVLLWKFMPGFSALRVWGRLNIVLVPILAWLLSLAYTSFELVILKKAVNSNLEYKKQFSPIVLLVVIYIVIISVQLHFYLNNISDSYWRVYFEHLSSQRVWFIGYGAIGFAVILFFIVFFRRVKFRSAIYPKVAMVVLLLVAVLEMRPVGTKIWAYRAKFQNSRVNLDVAGINEASFQFNRIDRKDSISLKPNFNVGVLENWYFNRYVKFLKKTEGELPARIVLLGVQDGTKVFFSESIGHEKIESFLRDTLRYRPAGHLLFYNGDELRWEIEAPIEGYLSFIDNWDCDWKVSVDDKAAEIELLFGTFKSVKITPGKHSVRFYYQPRLFPIK
jgi:hypothetical protein